MSQYVTLRAARYQFHQVSQCEMKQEMPSTIAYKNSVYNVNSVMMRNVLLMPLFMVPRCRRQEKNDFKCLSISLYVTVLKFVIIMSHYSTISM